jgi:hypothetical protein
LNAPSETVHLVPLSDLVDLALKGQVMRKAQRAYFDAKAGHQSGSVLNQLMRQAKDAERRFDWAMKAALDREKVSLPGFAGEGGDTCHR